MADERERKKESVYEKNVETLDGGEDEILHEFDVYSHSSLDADETKIKLIQYPFESPSKSYAIGKVAVKPTVRVDPLNSAIEFDVKSSFYVTETTLLTSMKQAPAMDVAVGVITGHELHLHPVDEVVQLRPSDKYDYNKEQPDNSHMITLEYHGNTSAESSEYLKKLIEKESSCANLAVMKPLDYMVSLFGGANMNDESRIKERSTEVEENIKKMLKSAPLHSFNELKNLALEYSSEQLVETLEKHAYLVQGHWIAKSGLLDAMLWVALARDYVLSLFSAGLIVVVNDHLHTDIRAHVEQFLKVFGQRTHNGDWEFISCANTDFINAEPELVIKHKRNFVDLKNHVLTTVATFGMRIPLADLLLELNLTNYKILRSGLHYMAQDKTFKKHYLNKRYFETALDCAENELPVHVKDVLDELAFNIHGTYVVKNPVKNPAAESEDYMKFRGVVIDLFRQNPPDSSFSKKNLIEETKNRYPDYELPDDAYQYVRKELLKGHHAGWSLRKGNEELPGVHGPYRGSYLDTWVPNPNPLP